MMDDRRPVITIAHPSEYFSTEKVPYLELSKNRTKQKQTQTTIVHLPIIVPSNPVKTKHKTNQIINQLKLTVTPKIMH